MILRIQVITIIMNIICGSCGASNTDTSTFCMDCGANVKKPEKPKYSNQQNNQPQAYRSYDQASAQSYPQHSRKLFRSRSNKVISGLCAGIAYHLDVDVTLVRILTVFLLLITGGAAFFVYIIAWILVPEEYPFESIDHQNITYRV
jgi:phage shock protein C